jgi:hypothetical protein
MASGHRVWVFVFCLFIGGVLIMENYITRDFYIQHIGNAKYCLSYYIGNTHSDGSKFYELRIFKSKKALNRFIKTGD